MTPKGRLISKREPKRELQTRKLTVKMQAHPLSDILRYLWEADGALQSFIKIGIRVVTYVATIRPHKKKKKKEDERYFIRSHRFCFTVEQPAPFTSGVLEHAPISRFTSFSNYYYFFNLIQNSHEHLRSWIFKNLGRNFISKIEIKVQLLKISKISAIIQNQFNNLGNQTVSQSISPDQGSPTFFYGRHNGRWASVARAEVRKRLLLC